jgi:hypothetical protein
MQAGVIYFNALGGDPLLRVLGEITADGTFTLRTQKNNDRAAGAPEGEYEIQIIPPLAAGAPGDLKVAHKGVAPIDLPQTLKVEPKENTFRIELPAP